MNLKKQSLITTPLACSIKTILRNITVAVIIAFILFLIFAFVITYTDIPYKYISPITVCITLASVFFAGFLNGRKTTEKGWLTGCVTGFLYMLLIYAVGVCLYGDFSITPAGIAMIGAGMFFAVSGSVIGINNKQKR